MGLAEDEFAVEEEHQTLGEDVVNDDISQSLQDEGVRNERSVLHEYGQEGKNNNDNLVQNDDLMNIDPTNDEILIGDEDIETTGR